MKALSKIIAEIFVDAGAQNVNNYFTFLRFVCLYMLDWLTSWAVPDFKVQRIGPTEKNIIVNVIWMFCQLHTGWTQM